MGISDDIRPRGGRALYHTSTRGHFDNETEIRRKDSPKDIDRPKEVNPEVKLLKHPSTNNLLQEEFFQSPEIQTNHDSHKHTDAKQAKTTPQIIGKVFVVIIFLAAIVLASYESYKKSRSLYDSSRDTTKTESSKEEYKGEVITQDYKPSDQTTAAPETASDTAATQNAQIAQSSSTPSTTIDKSKISLKVLNGNGITGSAASVKEELEKAGFTVASVTNAKSFSYKTTIIYYHTGKENEANLVKDALSSRNVSTSNSDSVTTSGDIVVVVGRK